MGGKSYYCDYCCCYMKNDLNVRKLHNEGTLHTAAKAAYMRRFENPRKVLAVESAKKPCKRFAAGYCKFQLLCSFGHYSEKQLQQLHKIVSKMKKKRRKPKEKQMHPLPPSLQPIKLEFFNQINWEQGWA